MNGIVELAKLLKERENRDYMGPQVGNVISPLPEIKIRLDENIILDKNHLLICEHLITKVGKFKLNGASNIGSTTLKVSTSQNYDIVDINIGDENKTHMENFYELKVGDKVLVIPTTDEQTYYVVDKVVRV
ncbi:MAG: DUF2577 domain-containing protein [Anaeromicrobium sp.]|jgi:hypothetical protein|uniref:DUF2577 family protein n=1 Tax=Anaeromicrobium sp. TaxID=1929132 RepID=UPI0025FB83D8|nr:DUF2577 family protein [Anaeromicrobium sp.]MCT4593588.1 DUF2577 domain-containing protein [Anaeromicrobium sp.]